jgi:hypothetical protein
MSLPPSGLPAAQALADADIVVITQLVGAVLESRRTTLGGLKDHVGGGGGSSVAPVANIPDQAHSLIADNVGSYLRTTYAGASTLTVQTNATEAIAVSSEVHVRAAGGELTLVEASGVTLNPPAGGTLVVPIDGAITLKKVGTDEWDVIGVTVPAS